MIHRKKKRIILSIIIISIIAMIATGVSWYFINKGNTDNETVKENIDFSSKRLVVTTHNNEALVENYNAKKTNKLYSGSYILKFETEEETRNAYEKLKNNSQVLEVIVDTNIEINNINIETLLISYGDGSEKIESWGRYTMGLDETQSKLNEKTSADEIVVAVLDSGFDLELEIAKTVSNRIDSRYINITDGSKDISDNHSLESATGEKILQGHGTHVGGIVLDSTPNNVKILPIKVEDEEGVIGAEYLKSAMQYAIEQNVDVINLSLGWELDNSNPHTVKETEEIGDLIEQAIENDIIVVAAAGNGDEEGNRINGENYYPVSYDGVIGVAALETNLIQINGSVVDGDAYNSAQQSTSENLKYTSFSNYGNMVDFSAPGKHILCLAPSDSIYATGTALPLFSGTSHACPHIASAVATLKSYNEEWDTEKINEILKYYTVDLGVAGRDNDYGYGYVNFNDFVECECSSLQCDEIYCFGCTSTECIYHEAQVKTLESIAVTSDPTNTVYTEGDIFNPAGMVVTATYSDNSTLEVTGYKYSPTEELKITDTTITISYTEGEITKTTTLGITVNAKTVEPPPQEKILESIAVTTAPTNTVYTEGDVFNPAGMVVTATYSDNTTAEVTGYTYSPTEELRTTDTTITISYTEGEITKTTTLGITVNSKPVEPPQEKTIVGIEITIPPTKTTYKEGDVFNPTGMVVTAIYSDGSKKITENYNCFPITSLTENNESVTVQYTENGKTVTAKVSIVVQSSSSNNGNNNNDNNSQNNNNQNNNNNPNNNVQNNNNIQNNNQNNNNASNNNSSNGNAIANKNNVQIQDNKVVDNTIKDQNIAFTGAEDYIIPIIIVSIIGIFSFIKYRQYKDI